MLNIVLPPMPQEPREKVGGASHPYNLISSLRPKIKYRNEMKQYEERLALLEKQWPGLKDCNYDVECYTRKCFYDILPLFRLNLLELSIICNRINGLKEAIKSYEKPADDWFPIDVSTNKKPTYAYYKELIQCVDEFEIFVDLYSTIDDAAKEANQLNTLSFTYGWGGKYFFAVSNIFNKSSTNIDSSYGAGYLSLIAERAKVISNNRSDYNNKTFYAVASCPVTLSTIITTPNKDSEIKDLQTRLQELKQMC